MNILETILAHKRQEVAQAEAKTPLSALEGRLASAPPVRSFRQALQRGEGRVAVIAEVKKASPSKGILREKFDPLQIARIYAQHGASAISVLTDERFFQGHLDYLRTIRKEVEVPLLRKDFVLSRYQVAEARVAGADAVLLIVAALSDEQLQDLLRYAHTLGMDALVEVHTEEEMRRALDVGAVLIGVNNRDLTTFHTTLEVTERLAPLLPPGGILVSESGIESAEDVRRVARAGAHAVLVGESLMRAEDIGAKLRELTSAT
ncbi:MAG: indole-3-glycerol phosphate synthase TrpC [Armatimonadota bacterium]|nr:indole-3-glycerol phosphate synthase TrpC [bacterium]MDW8103896.1 indole-3-glycerol phosphate synthase TrpC [Armatimonadota bacterium]MDW8289448.1 indole-3-glycerol phosphate synthase TrpC [Armatimonadota bacterium]